MKRIGIDARLYSQTGVGTYLQNLLYHIERNKAGDQVFYVYLLKEDAARYQSRFKSKNIVIRVADYQWHSFIEQIGFLFLLLKDNLDLMHFTYFSYPILYLKKFIATVHDTTPLQFKTGKASTKNQLVYQLKHLIFKLVLWFQVHQARMIITPTKSVKKELQKIYGDKISKKIIPIYEGVSEKIIKGKENKSLKQKYKDFFIYVGNFYPHKNVQRLITAFRKVNKKYKLILIGPDDYFSKRLKVYKNTILVKNPSLSDLIFFYKNSMAIIHPSLSEGFGLPLVEAAYFGTPIIASGIEVFKELWEDKYLSFNPYDVDDILKKINEFISIRPKFDYTKVLKKYSFEKMTDKTLKLYQNIL